MFLMHRVELKETNLNELTCLLIKVPNAPCGVESFVFFNFQVASHEFLMHRVELKEAFHKRYFVF